MTRRSLARFAGVLAGMALLLPRNSPAGWETGAKAGFDTNVKRSVSGSSGDVFFLGYGAYLHPVTGETRLDWTFSAVLEGAAYARNTGLDYGAISLSPGLVYNIGPVGTVSITPFLQYKPVNDTDQSAWAFGGRVDLLQRFGKNLYLGEYGAYTDSRARVDTYSYTEFAAGMVFGGNFRPGSFAEIGYEYSRGESFLTGTDTIVSTGTGGMGGGGPRHLPDLLLRIRDRSREGLRGFPFRGNLRGDRLDPQGVLRCKLHLQGHYRGRGNGPENLGIRRNRLPFLIEPTPPGCGNRRKTVFTWSGRPP
jgi:hypothetical protein